MTQCKTWYRVDFKLYARQLRLSNVNTNSFAKKKKNRNPFRGEDLWKALWKSTGWLFFLYFALKTICFRNLYKNSNIIFIFLFWLCIHLVLPVKRDYLFFLSQHRSKYTNWFCDVVAIATWYSVKVWQYFSLS